MKAKLIFLFIKKISIKKILNFIKIFLSYWISVILKKTYRWGMPYSISVEISNYCNLNCPQCPVGNGTLSRKKGNMNFKTFKRIIDQTHQYLLNCFLYFQGEPFLNPLLPKMIEYAHKKHIFTATATNGHFLSEKNAKKIVLSGLDYIIISLDGLTQQTYQIYRKNGNIQTVINGIKNLVNAKKKLNRTNPFIEVQTLLMSTNEHEIKKLQKFVYQLGVDNFKIKSMQIYDFKKYAYLLPKNQKYNRYKKINGVWQRRKKIKNRCWRLWNSAVITWDGKLLPCCFDKNAKYYFGYVNSENLKNLLRNDKFKKFAKQVLKNRSKIDICRNCTE